MTARPAAARRSNTPSPPLCFYRYLRDHAGNRMQWTLAASGTAGLAMGLTILVIARALDEFVARGVVSGTSALHFTVCATAYYWTRWAAAEWAMDAAFEATGALQVRLNEKVRQARCLELTQMERGHVYPMLAGSKDIVVEAARHMATWMSGAATLLAALAYGTQVSLIGSGLVAAMLAAMSLFLLSGQRRRLALLGASAEAEKALVSGMTDLVDGFVEIKLNRPRRDDFLRNHLRVLGEHHRAAHLAKETLQAKGLAFFAAATLLPVGATIFLLPRLADVSGEQAIKLLMVSFFSLTPMMTFVGFVSLSSQAWFTLTAIGGFERELDAIGDADTASAPQPPSFQRIDIPSGTFQYPGGFTLSVEGFSLERGSLVMLAGGNGSGKTTLMKVLAGLYPLASGDLLIDGRPVSEIGVDNYRGLFSVVFADFHLFDTLWGIDDAPAERVDAMLAAAGLADRVTYDQGRFSTIDLSSGQRKRLALICARLEDRPVLLFDEVAAGFDPRYRDRFYRELLPALRAEGRTVLAISHDDRYFDVADRVLYMEEGRLRGADAPASADTYQ